MRTVADIKNEITKRLLKLRYAGMDVLEIRKETGYSEKTILKYIPADKPKMIDKQWRRREDTTREQMLALRAKGMTNREIGEELCITTKDVNNRIGAGIRKESDRILAKGVYAMLQEELTAANNRENAEGRKKKPKAEKKAAYSVTPKAPKKDPWQANEKDCKGCRYFGTQPIMCCNYYQVTKVLKWEMPNECTRKEIGQKVKCDGDHDELLIHPDAKIDVDGNLVKIKRKDKMRDAMLR